jgi:hypothetical protein
VEELGALDPSTVLSLYLAENVYCIAVSKMSSLAPEEREEITY